MTRRLTVSDLPQLQRVVDAAMIVVIHAETKNDLLGLTMYVLQEHVYGLWDRLAELGLTDEKTHNSSRPVVTPEDKLTYERIQQVAEQTGIPYASVADVIDALCSAGLMRVKR